MTLVSFAYSTYFNVSQQMFCLYFYSFFTLPVIIFSFLLRLINTIFVGLQNFDVLLWLKKSIKFWQQQLCLFEKNSVLQCAHVMAMAVQKLYPDAKVTIGPWIENGFYYDFEMDPLTDKDLKRIKKEMVSSLSFWLPFL